MTQVAPTIQDQSLPKANRVERGVIQRWYPPYSGAKPPQVESTNQEVCPKALFWSLFVMSCHVTFCDNVWSHFGHFFDTFLSHNTRQHNTTQDNTTHHNIPHHNTSPHKTRQDNTTQDKTTQHKANTRQDKTRHDKTRQDKISQIIWFYHIILRVDFFDI